MMGEEKGAQLLMIKFYLKIFFCTIEFTCPLISGQVFLHFWIIFAKIEEKNIVQKFTDESSLEYLRIRK